MKKSVDLIGLGRMEAYLAFLIEKEKKNLERLKLERMDLYRRTEALEMKSKTRFKSEMLSEVDITEGTQISEAVERAGTNLSFSLSMQIRYEYLLLLFQEQKYDQIIDQFRYEAENNPAREVEVDGDRFTLISCLIALRDAKKESV